MATSLNTMKEFFNVLKRYSNDTHARGMTMLDNAVKETTRFKDLEDAVEHFIDDMARVTKNFSAKKSLYQNCGIILGEDKDFTADTGAVSGYNAGNHVVKDAQSIVPETTTLDKVELPAEGAVTEHTYTGADGKQFSFTITYPESFLLVRDMATAPTLPSGDIDDDKAKTIYLEADKTYTDPPDDESGECFSAKGSEIAAGIETVIKGIENFWAEQGFKLAYDSFGTDFDGKNLTISFGVYQNSQAATGPAKGDPAHTRNVPAENIDMQINAVMYAHIDPTDSSGNTRVDGGTNQNYLDRTIAHELIHAVMQASGTLRNDMPQFFTEGVAELVHGLDDYDSNYTDEVYELAASTTLLKDNMSFKPGTGSKYAYPAGEMFLRYLCKQSFAESYYLNQIVGSTTDVETYDGYTDEGKNITPPEYDGAQVIILNEGDQTLTLGDEDKRVAVVSENGFGTKNIIFGDGNSMGIFVGANSPTNVTLGAGKESLVVDNFSSVNFDMTKAAANTEIVLATGAVTLDGYDFDKHAAIALPNVNTDAEIELVGSALQFDTVASIEPGDSDFVRLTTSDDSKHIIGRTAGGSLDGSSISGKQILFGGESSTVRGGSKNDTIFTGANGTVSLSGGTDIVYLEGRNAELRLGDGTVDGTARIVYGFSNSDTVIVNDAEDLSVKIVKDTLRLRKNDSVLIFDELTNLEGANGLQVQSGDETYTLRTDYDGGLTKADYFWQDDANNFYRPDSTLVINDDGTRREYFIEEGSGRVKIDDFNFATDAINLKSIDGLTYMGSNLFIKPSDDDWVVIEGGAGKNINVNIGGEKFVGQLGKQLTYDDDVTNYIGEKISVSAAQVGDIDIDLSDDKFCDVHVLDAGAFNGGDATLIGGDLDDKITASKGAASLWGGVGGNDILIGNGAGNTFHYLLGDGNDEIRDAHDGDAINLLDVTLADIASADVNSWGVRLTMNDGGTLTVNSTADVTYNLSDGSFKANHQSREWQQA